MPTAEDLSERAAAVLRPDASAPPPAEILEIRRMEKRLISALSFVPLWGPLRLWRSDFHSAREKIGHTALSLLLTFALAGALWAMLPGPAERVAATRARVEDQLGSLAGLVEQYRRQYGSYPDEETWRRSAARGDPRFQDPWGRAYAYRREGQGFLIGSFGRDAAPGGRGEDADVFVRR